MDELNDLPLEERQVILGRREWEMRLDLNEAHVPKLPDVIVLNGVRFVPEKSGE